MSCTTRANAWLKDNTMVVQLGTLISLNDATDDPLTDAISGAVITDATVTARLLRASGSEVTGETWPITLTHVSGGVYRGGASYAVAVEVGVDYVVEIVATKSGNRGTWRVPVTAYQRES